MRPVFGYYSSGRLVAEILTRPAGIARPPIQVERRRRGEHPLSLVGRPSATLSHGSADARTRIVGTSSCTSRLLHPHAVDATSGRHSRLQDLAWCACQVRATNTNSHPAARKRWPSGYLGQNFSAPWAPCSARAYGNQGYQQIATPTFAKTCCRTLEAVFSGR